MLDENPEEIISLGLGNKLYEMSNHLGNFNDTWLSSKESLSGINPVRNETGVLTVINDIKVPQSSNSVDVDGYLATIVSTADYSPFGVQLDERTVSVESYHYGFQGQEKDDEIKGAGNSVNYTYRMHDPRLGRFLSLDPLAADFPWNSPYVFSENRVLDAIELEGLEALLVHHIKILNGKPYFYIINDNTVERNATVPFQIRIPANTFKNQPEELIYYKDKSSPNENFDFMELQQNLFENFKIDEGAVIWNKKKLVTATGYSSKSDTGNMEDFSILIDASNLYRRIVNDFSFDVDLSSGNQTISQTAPASTDGFAHYDLTLKDFQISGNGTENPFSVINTTTNEVIFSNVTVASVKGRIEFNIPSGHQFEIRIQQDPAVVSDIFSISGTEVIGQ